MDRLELVNSEAHARIRVRPADQTGLAFVRVVTSEFPQAAVACPLLFSKHADTGAFYIGALKGFRPGETLMDRPDGRTAFRPLESEREGFFAVGENIALDADHERFNAADGDPLFDASGRPTPVLKAVQGALGRLMAGAEATDLFISAMVAHRLIEPIDIALSFDDGERLRLDGLYTISLDALGDLADDAALALLRAGHLQSAYMMATSTQHIALMARRRNERLAAAA